MHKKHLNYLSLIVIMGCVLCGSNSLGQGDTPESQIQPNIVLIVADDLGIFDLGCYGRQEHKTPHLDSLATQGIRYSSAYCGLSICSASRASLLTGKYASRLHITTYLPGRPDAPSQMLLQPRIQSYLPLEEQTLAELLKKIGYRTGLFGKWHLGSGEHGPTHQGFDEAFEPSGNGELDENQGGKNEFAIVNSAIKFLKASDAPAFCYVPHHSPHIGLAAPKQLIEKNANSFNPLYAATVESLDASIGKLLAVVDGLSRPTIVIFTSDNGGLHVPEGHELPVTHNGAFRAGKGYLYEGGLRVPLIVRWPNKIAAGQTIDAPVSTIDLMPTLLDAVGIDQAKTVGPLDGMSLKSQWLGNSSTNANAEHMFYWHLPHYTNQGSRPSAAVRQGKWKLVESLEDNQAQLFDLENDISEQMDVAAMFPDQASKLQEALHQWQNATGAQACTKNPNLIPELHRRLYIDSDPTRLNASKATAKSVGEQWRVWRAEINRVVAGKKPPLKDPSHEIHLAARDGKTHGKNLRYEPESYKNVIGYWTEVDDWADWELDVPAAGKFEVEVHYGCGVPNGGSLVAIEVADQSIPWTVRGTGHFQNIIIQNIGEVELKAGKQRLAARPKSKSGVAIVDIRRIVLRPIAN
jgi:arylsulfatase A